MKMKLSKFFKFSNSISREWLTAIVSVFALAAIMPRVGKVWQEDEPMLWVVFFPMMLLRDLAQYLEIPPDQGMIVLILLGTPLAVLYWSVLFFGVQQALRLIFRNQFRR